LTAVAVLDAARRPRYGGELRIETRAALQSLDPAIGLDDPVSLRFREQLIPAVFETLVRIDENGNPQPQLAIGWTRDTARKRWIFTPRPNVAPHGGSLWTTENGGTIEVPDDRPIEQILRELAQPQNAIVIRGEDGSLTGTGPFRIARFTAGK